MNIEEKIKQIDNIEDLNKIVEHVEKRLNHILNRINEYMRIDDIFNANYNLQQANEMLQDFLKKIAPYKSLMSYLAYIGLGSIMYKILKTKTVNDLDVVFAIISFILLGIKNFIKMMNENQRIADEHQREKEYYQNISSLLEEHANFLRNNPDYVIEDNYSSFSAICDIRECWNAQKFYNRNKELLEKKYRKGKLDKFLANFCFYGDERNQVKQLTEEGLGQSRNLTREQNNYS